MTSRRVPVWRQAPLRWRGKVDLDFCEADYRWLEPAGSLKNPEIVSRWLRRLERGLPIPPPVVCLTQQGTLYLHDGNHRHEAMEAFFLDRAESARIRVAVLVPRRGFQFRYHWFGSYGTYILERVERVANRALNQLHAAAQQDRRLSEVWYSPLQSLVAGRALITGTAEIRQAS